MSDPYLDWVRRFAALLHEDLPLPPPEPVAAPSALRPDAAGRPLCLLLSPHPDDECITGALPLRLQREAGWRVLNLAVTLGSAPARRAARAVEVQAACAQLGFALELPSQADLQTGPEVRIARALNLHRPKLVLMPHAEDAQPTHRRVSAWGRAAIEASGQAVDVAFTEYWSTLHDPNLLVLCDAVLTADLVRALACHVGEVRRNPYHLSLPAMMADSVRRGGELVLGAGSQPPRGEFAAAYRHERFDGRRWSAPADGQVWGLGQAGPFVRSG